MNKVKVSIYGNEYTMVSEKDEAEVLKIAKYIDEEMKSLSEKYPKLSGSQVSILTTINITEQLFDCGYENEALNNEKQELTKQNKELLNKIESGGEEAKFELKKVQGLYDNLKKDCEDKKLKINSLNEEIEKLKEEINSLNETINSSKNLVENSESEILKYKELAEESAKKATLAEQLATKFQNDNYKIQLEKAELENELKELKK